MVNERRAEADLKNLGLPGPKKEMVFR